VNTTERVILEQFAYWQGGLERDIPPAAADAFVFVGCGTSYYIAQTLAAAFNLNGRRAIAAPGGEWTYRHKVYLSDLSGAEVVAISRSGESTEAVSALTVSRKLGLATTAITCAEDSSVAKAADRMIFAPTHPDEGIVMTASASLMLMMGLRWAGETVEPRVIAAARAGLEAMAGKAPALVAGRSKFVTLGSGAYYGVACEGALKLQEMSISVSQPFHAMEYRHGPISLADRDMAAIVLYGEDAPEEDAKIVAELQAKGVAVIGLGGPGDLTLPTTTHGLQRTLEMLPALQILGERIAIAKRIDSTAPRNLTKVVRLG